MICVCVNYDYCSHLLNEGSSSRQAYVCVLILILCPKNYLLGILKIHGVSVDVFAHCLYCFMSLCIQRGKQLSIYFVPSVFIYHMHSGTLFGRHRA